MRAALRAVSFFTPSGVGSLWIGEGLAIGLKLKSKGIGSYNVLGSNNVVGPNVSCHIGSRIVMIRNQGVANTTPTFQHALPLLV